MERRPTVVAVDDGESRGDSTDQHLTSRGTRKGKKKYEAGVSTRVAQKGSFTR